MVVLRKLSSLLFSLVSNNGTTNEYVVAARDKIHERRHGKSRLFSPVARRHVPAHGLQKT